MATQTNLRGVYVGRHKLTSYRTDSQERVRIEAEMRNWFFLEEGVAQKGGKKERQEIGEFPCSVIFQCDNDSLEIRLDNTINIEKINDPPRISLEYLNGLARRCKKKSLSHEDAYEFFFNKLY